MTGGYGMTPKPFKASTQGRGQILCANCQHGGGTLQTSGQYPDGSKRYVHPGCPEPVKHYEKPRG